MAKKLAILVCVPASDEKRTAAAFEHCTLLAQQSSSIDHVFFYFDAVFNASVNAPYHAQWNAYSKQYKITLIACATLASTRNLESDSAHAFEFAGLSEFYRRLHDCETIVQVK